MKNKILVAFIIFVLACSVFAQASVDYTTEELDIIRFSKMELENDLLERIIQNGDLSYLNYKLNIISLSMLSGSNLRILRNTIFAKYGMTFLSFDLKNHFTNFSWYKPSETNVEKKLTELDIRNIILIKAFESSHVSAATMDPSELTGVWQELPVVASGWAERFMFYSNGKVIYGYSTMRQLPLVEYLFGTYSINNGVLEIRFDEKRIFEHSKETEYSKAFGYQWRNSKSINRKIEPAIECKFPIRNVGKQTMDRIGERFIIEIAGIRYYLISNNPDEGLKK